MPRKQRPPPPVVRCLGLDLFFFEKTYFLKKTKIDKNESHHLKMYFPIGKWGLSNVRLGFGGVSGRWNVPDFFRKGTISSVDCVSVLRARTLLTFRLCLGIVLSNICAVTLNLWPQSVEIFSVGMWHLRFITTLTYLNTMGQLTRTWKFSSQAGGCWGRKTMSFPQGPPFFLFA